LATRILLTGANGFVGSRILARLHDLGHPVVLLLRPTGSRRLIDPLPSNVEVRHGSVGDIASLTAALDGVTHVIHCAGLTKALSWSDFEAVNVRGTRNLVDAANGQPAVRQFILISSLAAHGPGSKARPAREANPNAPVSLYGRSKLMGELEVRHHCRSPHVILRPSGVYGPGDSDFLQLFKTVRRGLCPAFGGGRQELTLLHADDLAAVVVGCLDRDAGSQPVFHVAHPQVVTAAELALEVARQLHVKARVLNLPNFVLSLASGMGECVSRLTRKPSVLSLDRLRELQAPGWVCDPTHLRETLDLECRTALPEGIAQTVAWYRQHRWL
jgi:nucleoside-diphosphate-sugar epimerase